MNGIRRRPLFTKYFTFAAIAGGSLVLAAYYWLAWGERSSWTGADWYQEAVRVYEGARLPLAFQALEALPREATAAISLLLISLAVSGRSQLLHLAISLTAALLFLKVLADILLFNAIGNPWHGGHVAAVIGGIVAAIAVTALAVLRLTDKGPRAPLHS